MFDFRDLQRVFFIEAGQELYKHMDNDYYHNNYLLARNLMSQ
jgi:hypothetical protein